MRKMTLIQRWLLQVESQDISGSIPEQDVYMFIYYILFFLLGLYIFSHIEINTRPEIIHVILGQDLLAFDFVHNQIKAAVIYFEKQKNILLMN